MRVRFDKELTKAINNLSKRHGIPRTDIVRAAISMYKGISDLDALADTEEPGSRFSDRIKSIAEKVQSEASGVASGAALQEFGERVRDKFREGQP